MKRVAAFGFTLVIALGVRAAEPVTSGPQAGEKVPGPFKPLNVTGPDAGQEECLYCKNGSRPVVMVFTRELTPGVVTLIKKLDAATVANSEGRLASCVIVLNDGKDLAPSLAKWPRCWPAPASSRPRAWPWSRWWT